MGFPNSRGERTGGDTGRTPSCISEEQLELYSMGRVTPALEAAIDEHLLICHHCQDLLAETDEFVVHARAALSRRREDEPGWSRLKHWLSNPGSVRRMWLAAPAAALLLAILATPYLRHTAGQPVDVELRAFRAAVEQAEASAPTSVPLNLRLTVEDLPEGGKWTADVVDAGGSSIQRTNASVRRGVILVGVPQGLKPGRYWVRLLAGDATASQVREYSLVVR